MTHCWYLGNVYQVISITPPWILIQWPGHPPYGYVAPYGGGYLIPARQWVKLAQVQEIPPTLEQR